MKFVESKVYNNSVYFTLETNEGRDPFILTDTFFFDNTEKTDYSITCRINRLLSETLYQSVQQLESEIVLALKEMNEAMYSTLPFECQKQLADHPRDMYPQLMRSNYVDQGGYPTMFLKGNFRNMKLFSLHDNRVLSPQELTTGNYRFKIRANLIYFGKHKKPYQIVNLQLRISEIYFQPTMSPMLQSIEPISFSLDQLLDADPIEPPSKPTRKRKLKKKEETKSPKKISTEPF